MSLQSDIESYDNHLAIAYAERSVLYSELVEVGNYIIAENFYQAGWKLRDAAWRLRYIHALILEPASDNDEGYQSQLGYILYRLQKVTWQSIAEAWIADDFEGRAVTIALIDRMRQILWDEPFQVIWAAKPEEQEF